MGTVHQEAAGRGQQLAAGGEERQHLELTAGGPDMIFGHSVGSLVTSGVHAGPLMVHPSYLSEISDIGLFPLWSRSPHFHPFLLMELKVEEGGDKRMRWKIFSVKMKEKDDGEQKLVKNK